MYPRFSGLACAGRMLRAAIAVLALAVLLRAAWEFLLALDGAFNAIAIGGGL